MSDRPQGLRSGELARAAGISTDTLRHYEKLGVLAKAPRTPSGYRVYPPDSPERVNMIRHALRLGFTLAELAEVLHARNRGGTPCKRVFGMLEDKLIQLETYIEELQSTHRYMQQIAEEWRSKLELVQPGSRAHLLHSLGTDLAPVANTHRLSRRKQR